VFVVVLIESLGEKLIEVFRWCIPRSHVHRLASM
jgi:hypothetical protein